MSNALSWVLGTVLWVGLLNAPGSASATPVYTPLVAGNTDFALNLFGRLQAANSGNLFFSPYSISTCFGMVYAGARGQTALQMAGALDLSTNQADVGSEFGALQSELNAQQDVNGISLNVANGLWAQTNYPFLPAFPDNASTNYDASVQQVNFITDSPEITAQINTWVADQTDGMIPNVLAQGTLNAATRLALVNAIYFNGGWQSVFNTNSTEVEPFFVSPGQYVSAPMMNQQEFARYYEDNLLQAVELPYINSNLTMLVLLPESSGTMSLTAAELSAVINGLEPKYMDIHLPRFKLDMNINLVPLLENMGMVAPFSAGADFSGIDGGLDLSIGSATHEAVVDVNETGTVAAASTVIGIISTAVPEPTLFQANHPFMFLIRDTNSASILFMGQVANPTAASTTTATTTVRPSILASGGSFAIKNQQFGFTVAGTNATLVVEACTNLMGGAWTPIQTLTLTNGSACFSEPWQSNSPGRFYRVHTP